jgi:hypothetical protein
MAEPGLILVTGAGGGGVAGVGGKVASSDSGHPDQLPSEHHRTSLVPGVGRSPAERSVTSHTRGCRAPLVGPSARRDQRTVPGGLRTNLPRRARPAPDAIPDRLANDPGPRLPPQPRAGPGENRQRDRLRLPLRVRRSLPAPSRRPARSTAAKGVDPHQQSRSRRPHPPPLTPARLTSSAATATAPPKWPGHRSRPAGSGPAVRSDSFSPVGDDSRSRRSGLRLGSPSSTFAASRVTSGAASSATW